MNIIENKQLYDYLKQNYSKTCYRFKRIFKNNFPYKRFKLDEIEKVEIKNIGDLSGIDELSNLNELIIKGKIDFKTLDEVNIPSIKIELDDRADINSLIKISNNKNVESFYIYGKGIKYISSKMSLKFSDNTKFSYDNKDYFNKEKFSKIQEKLEKIHLLVRPGLKDHEKVSIIYNNLLSKDFTYNGKYNSIYDTLVLNRGSDKGISSSLEIALTNSSIDAITINGFSNNRFNKKENYNWNQVKIDGKWYNLDLCMDFGEKESNYFLKSDNDLKWKKCHYINKNDSTKKYHSCFSSIYDKPVYYDKKDEIESNKNIKAKRK